MFQQEATLRILYAFSLYFASTAQNQSITVYENEETVLPCNHGLTVWPGIFIDWLRGSDKMALASYISYSGRTTIARDWVGRANFTLPFTAGNVKISSSMLIDDAFHRCRAVVLSNFVTRTINLIVLVKPSMPSINGVEAVIKEGDSVPIICTVTRVKPANLVGISWTVQDNPPLTGVTSSTKNDDYKTFQVRNAATLSVNRQQDGKTLTCHVRWNSTADFTTASKILNVHYPPRSVSLTPGGATTVKQGTKVSMTCQIGEGGAKPLPKLSIFKEGITVKSQDNTAQMTHTMTIHRDDNRKVFKCKATGGVISGSVDSHAINYDVMYPASSVTVTGVSGPVLQGSNVTLHCQGVDGNPDTYTYKWTHERKGPRSDLAGSSSTLTLSDIQYTAAGKYNCQATNEYGPAEGFKDVIVHYPPRSVSLTQGGATRVKHGTLVSMTCQIGKEGANPLPTLSIFKEGIPVKSQDSTEQMTLTMTVQREDNGKEFRCKATGGVISGSVDSQGINYDVLYPASSVLVTGASGPVLEGKTVTLHCQAVDGNPDTYTYEWTHERNGPRSDLAGSSSTLTLTDIQYTAAGQYKCQATNDYGPAEGFKDVIVHYSPKEDPDKTPNFKVWAKIGDTKNLTMHVVALPANVEFTWLHIKRTVKTDNLINNGLSSTLTLVNMRETDFGTYICIARNAINRPAAFLFYVLRQAPLTPEDINVRRTAVSLTVKWKRRFDGGFKHFKVRYRKIGTSEVKETGKIKDPFPGSDYAEIKLAPLVPSTEYDLYVVAFSDLDGDSETAGSHVRAQTSARPQFNLDKVIVEYKQNDAKLTWVKPTGQYTHYVIEWCEKPGTTNCKSENQGNKTTGTTVSGLSDGQEYSFALKVYDGDDLVGELKEFSPTDGKMDPLPIATGVLLILMIIIGVTVMLRRRTCEGSRRDSTYAETKGRSGGEQTLTSTIIADTSRYGNPLSKTSSVGTSGTTEYVNACFHAGNEVAEINSPVSDWNQHYAAYQNMKPEVKVHKDVPSLPHAPTNTNTQEGAQVNHTGECEQFSSDARTPHSNNEPNECKQLERC